MTARPNNFPGSPTSPPSFQRGSALGIVLASILIVSIVVSTFAQFAGARRKAAVADAKHFQARLVAESGIALGLHPEIDPGDPALRGTTESGITFQVRILPEGGRYPINRADQDGQPEALRRLFEAWGVDPENASLAADSLADWIDSDNKARGYGAESEFYEALEHYENADLPRNADFQSIDEMLMVRGMGAVDRIRPDWREFFTVYGSGTIDINGASTSLLEAVTDVSASDAERLLTIRSGGDGIPNTEDDVPFEDLGQVQRELGIPDDEWSALEPFLTTESTTVRIQSLAETGDHQVVLTVIAERQDESYSYVARFER